jgi:hypothetical protein
MARGLHKSEVLWKHPKAKLQFAQGLGYFIEVEGKHMSSYQWSPVNAWAQADLWPIFSVGGDGKHDLRM